MSIEGTKWWKQGRAWRRIGILLSVIWVIGVPVLFWVDRVHYDINTGYASRIQTCRATLEADNKSLQSISKPDERHNKADANRINYVNCIKGAEGSLHIDLVLLKDWTPIIMAVTLAMVLIAWVFIWSVVLIVRWIRRALTAG